MKKNIFFNQKQNQTELKETAWSIHEVHLLGAFKLSLSSALYQMQHQDPILRFLYITRTPSFPCSCCQNFPNANNYYLDAAGYITRTNGSGGRYESQNVD